MHGIIEGLGCWVVVCVLVFLRCVMCFVFFLVFQCGLGVLFFGWFCVWFRVFRVFSV